MSAVALKKTRLSQKKGGVRPLREKWREPAPKTPLAQRLVAKAKARPQDLFYLALAKWNAGERFDLGKMAKELEVGRATVFRWVGSRELLYGEVVSTLFDAALQKAVDGVVGRGAEAVGMVTRHLMESLMGDRPLRTFVRQDPAYAMRILMSKSCTVEHRSAESVRRVLEDQVRIGRIRPIMDLSDLAYLIVRIGQSFLYRDAITGDPPNIDPAIFAIQILVAAEAPLGR